MITDDFLPLLRSVRKSGAGFIACCPGHEDRHQSLSIATGADDRILLKCHAGCPAEQIMEALGLTLADLMPERQDHASKEIAATYDYVGPEGSLVFQVVRYLPKDFRQRRPDGSGGWEWKLGDTQRVLYHLPQLLEAIAAGRRVLLVEGEKDVHTLEAMGFVATTNAGGAGKWTEGYTRALTGAHVAILPDNDEPGRHHAKLVAAALQGRAASVKIVELPGLPEKGDVSDWAIRGGTAESLKALITTDTAVKTPTLLDAIQKVARYKTEAMPPSVDFPWQAVNRRTRGLRPGWLCIVAGYPGSGKTAFALETTFAVAKRQQRVLLDSLEMNDEELGLRMVQRWGLDTDRLYRGHLTDADRDAFDCAANFPFYENVHLVSERTMSGLEARVEEQRPSLVIIDYIGLMDMGRDNAQEGTTKLSRALKSLARRYDVPVMVLSQLSRPADKQKVSAPTMFDLRASGALEADADQIIIVFRDDTANVRETQTEGRFIVAKSRHGHPGKPVRFTFDGERQTFQVYDEAEERAAAQGWSVYQGAGER
jgi:putative DNA primase/helicase